MLAKPRKDGLIQRQVTINGKRKSFYGHNEREINRKIAEYKEENRHGPKFKEVAEEWEKEHFPTLEYNTLKGYRPALKRSIEEFGGQYIRSIAAKSISLYLERMAKKGYAQKTVRTQLLVINLICAKATLDGDIEYNPAASVKIPKGLSKTRREMPNEGDIEKVKKSIRLTFGLFAYFILYTGCRRGEALALTYGDIDRKNNVIHINKSVYHDNNRPYIKQPKTEAGCRNIILLDVLANKLPINRKKADLLFPNADGGLLTETQFQRQWKLYQKESGVSATPHQLRHAYATILFEAGLDDKDAQELLGHANISTTRDIYTHITNKHREETAKKLNAAVK